MSMKILSLLTLLAILIVSCQKESSTEPPSNVGNGNNPPANDSILLSKYIELDPTLPAGSDTTFQESYTYDNKKRLSHVHTKFYGADETDDFFYSGTDSLPVMIIRIWTSSQGNKQRDTTFYSYANGLINTDSTVTYNYTTNQYAETSAFVYTLEGNNTLFQYRLYSAVLPVEELKFTLF